MSRVVTSSVPGAVSSKAVQTVSTRGMRRRSPGWLTMSWAMIANTSTGASKRSPDLGAAPPGDGAAELLAGHQLELEPLADLDRHDRHGRRRRRR